VEESVELLFDVVSEVGEVFVEILWAGGWKLELHSGELIDNVFLESFLNQSKGDLLVTVLGFSNNSLGVIVEVHDGSHHTDGLWKWAVLVIWGERVLLQEFLFDDLSNSEDDLLILRKGVLSDQLNDFGQIFFVLQDLLDGSLHLDEVWVVVGIEAFKGLIVLGIGDVPVERWEMLSLGEFLIQSPEDLHDIQSGSSNWIGEVTTWWGHGTDDSDRSLSVWRTKASNSSGSLVEHSELSSQVSWETSIGGHFSKTSRNFSKSLSPSGGGVSHHSDVVSHISEVLGKSNTSVNGGLSGSDRHVGSVGDEASTVHDGVFLSLELGLEVWEFFKYLSHLVSSLSTSDVNDTVRVGVLGQGLGNTGLSTTEGTWNGACSSLHRWEKSIQNSLSSQKWVNTREFHGDGSWFSDWPEMTKADMLFLSVHVNGADWVLDSEVSTSLDFFYDTMNLWWNKNLMVSEKIVFENRSQDISLGDELSLFDELAWLKGPLFILVKAWYIDSSWDVH
jgi:hypothetical protein